jgi:hypothetical protein
MIISPSISDEQQDFVCGRSTVISLLEISNFVLSEMGDGFQVDADYADFLKAFYSESKIVIGDVDSKIPLSEDILDGFLFDRSCTTRSGWR